MVPSLTGQMLWSKTINREIHTGDKHESVMLMTWAGLRPGTVCFRQGWGSTIARAKA